MVGSLFGPENALEKTFTTTIVAATGAAGEKTFFQRGVFSTFSFLPFRQDDKKQKSLQHTRSAGMVVGCQTDRLDG